MELVFATGNANKAKEIAQVLGGQVRVKSLTDLGFVGEIPEEQETLEGNALQKAQFIAERYGCNCFADDTGLEVPRWAGVLVFILPDMPARLAMQMPTLQSC